MGGDLNLKKSWHPVLMSNQRKVWQEETKALEERKRIVQLQKERAEERQIQELQEMQESAGGKKRLNRVDWMYNGPSTGQAGNTEEMEGYLLGKRRIDNLLKDKETARLEKAATEESFMALQKANTMRDTASKIRDDPMLAIKKQEQEALEAIYSDPIKRRALLKAAGQDADEDNEREHRKHRYHRDRHGQERRRHRDDRDRHRDGDKERDFNRHKSRRRDSFDYDRRHHRGDGFDDSRRHQRNGGLKRRRSSSSSISRSPSPHRRSRSPRRRRSPSPYRTRRRSSPHHQSGSPERHINGRSDLRHSKSWHGPGRSSPSRDDGRAAKLAAMQQAASDLDQDREKRLQEMAQRDAIEREKDDIARARSSKLGGRGDFLVDMNRRAGELGVGDRMHRGRRGYEKDVD